MSLEGQPGPQQRRAPAVEPQGGALSGCGSGVRLVPEAAPLGHRAVEVTVQLVRGIRGVQQTTGKPLTGVTAGQQRDGAVDVVDVVVVQGEPHELAVRASPIRNSSAR